ncbi:hypothetical protein BHF71_02525 [Vulcanibacillus modesticaldus]|uniref:AAA domain-containing protein n=2 Tax=Vulcanibacillus modesticaldus TaxID=337097 RepID=A0A1D2YTR5_9BACI|nr:hypothetical protein BHF71_02525 [Vulcanibacillus modesticaldus]
MLERYLKTNRDIDILLIDPELVPDERLITGIDVIILLEELDHLNEESAFPTILKYQPLNQLISRIFSIYLENHDKAKKKFLGKKRTTVLSVYSALGGSGKTTLAVNLVKTLTTIEKNVFYLNLEYLGSTEFLFSSKRSNDFAKLLYYLKTNQEQLVSKIEALKKYDLNLKVDYFEHFSYPEEIQEMSKNDIEILIDALVNIGNYDYIIIDLDSSLNERIIGSMNKSNYVLWLLLDDIIGLQKTTILLNQLKNTFNSEYQDFYRKISFILNKFLGQDTKNDITDFGFQLNGYLPYIPDWKTITDGQQLTNQKAYSDQVLNLIKALI